MTSAAAPTEPPQLSLGERIRIARGRAGVNQATLADRASVSRASISNWEQGRHTPSTRELARLSRALETTIDSLLPETYYVSDETGSSSLRSRCASSDGGFFSLDGGYFSPHHVAPIRDRGHLTLVPEPA